MMKYTCKDVARILFKEDTNDTFVQLFRYTIVGGVSFLADYGLLLALANLLGLNYILSATISFICGLCINYLLSTQWIFKSHTIKNSKVEFAIYALIGVVGLVINDVCLYLLTDVCSINLVFSKPLVAGIVYLWNFFARKYILFFKK